eukprot:4683722-Prymnesium_polylepis.3
MAEASVTLVDMRSPGMRGKGRADGLNTALSENWGGYGSRLLRETALVQAFVPSAGRNGEGMGALSRINGEATGL